MRNNQGLSTPGPITAIFWDPWSVGSAMTALLRAGFSDTDLYAVGVLAGHAPDLHDFLDSLGISAADAAYYNDCFQDGAVLLIVGAQVSGDQQCDTWGSNPGKQVFHEAEQKQARITSVPAAGSVEVDSYG